MQHDWIPSTLGHGETMCSRCKATNCEAAAIGLLECDVPPPPPKTANDNRAEPDDYMMPDDDNEYDIDDEIAEAEMNCGKMPNGQCSQAGTEYCDWSCLFSR